MALLRGVGVPCRSTASPSTRRCSAARSPVWPMCWHRAASSTAGWRSSSRPLGQPRGLHPRRALPHGAATPLRGPQWPFCGFGAVRQPAGRRASTGAERDTYIQRDGINHDFGVFDTPDDFYARHGTSLAGPQALALPALGAPPDERQCGAAAPWRLRAPRDARWRTSHRLDHRCRPATRRLRARIVPLSQQLRHALAVLRRGDEAEVDVPRCQGSAADAVDLAGDLVRAASFTAKRRCGW